MFRSRLPKCIAPLLLTCCSAWVAAQATSEQAKPTHAPRSGARPAKTPAKFFPYEIRTQRLGNGFAVVVIRTPEFKDMVTFATVVFAGSRNETERGKTGLAHLFEHIMFRHEFGGVTQGYEEQLRRMGADNNAWTDYDLTFYHPTTFTANLKSPVQYADGTGPGLIELEASRFKGLKLDRKTFQVEAGAVLGEYRRIFSDPSQKMIEQMSPLAFPNHPYGHTVIGYVQDVENMPNAWDAAWEFFRHYYAPNDCALVVVGDVGAEQIFSEVERYYGDWKPAAVPMIPPETQPQAEQRLHVPWEADVAPRLMVAYHTPAMSPGARETAVTEVLPELLVSRSAPLFQKLRYQKQTVTDFSIAGGSELLEATDPHLLTLNAELILERLQKDGKAYVENVEKDITRGVDDLKDFSKSPDAARTLAVVKSKYRNDTLASLDSTLDIAQQFGWYYRFNRNPQVFEVLMQTVDALTPADIDAYVRKYFTPQQRVITTLWHEPQQEAK